MDWRLHRNGPLSKSLSLRFCTNPFERQQAPLRHHVSPCVMVDPVHERPAEEPGDSDQPGRGEQGDPVSKQRGRQRDSRTVDEQSKRNQCQQRRARAEPAVCGLHPILINECEPAVEPTESGGHDRPGCSDRNTKGRGAMEHCTLCENEEHFGERGAEQHANGQVGHRRMELTEPCEDAWPRTVMIVVVLVRFHGCA